VQEVAEVVSGSIIETRRVAIYALDAKGWPEGAGGLGERHAVGLDAEVVRDRQIVRTSHGQRIPRNQAYVGRPRMSENRRSATRTVRQHIANVSSYQRGLV
jgi:hypothetical protein